MAKKTTAKKTAKAKVTPRKTPQSRKKTVSKKKVVVKLSRLDKIKKRLAFKDVKEKRKKELARVPAGHKGLFHHLEKSGTGKNKLDFLLSLDFDAEKDQTKIAELAAVAFDEAGYSDTTITKILQYADIAGSNK